MLREALRNEPARTPRRPIHHLGCSLADDDEAHDDGLPRALFSKEFVLGEPVKKLQASAAACSMCSRSSPRRLSLIPAAPPQAPWPGTSRGRSAGVSRSTCTPSRDSSSSCKPPRSKRVAPGSASTRRSRSLPSSSVPCSTEPEVAGIRRAKAARRLAHCAPLEIKCDGGSHGQPFFVRTTQIIERYPRRRYGGRPHQCPDAPAAPTPVSERTCCASKSTFSIAAYELRSSTENSQMPTKPMVIEKRAGEVWGNSAEPRAVSIE